MGNALVGPCRNFSLEQCELCPVGHTTLRPAAVSGQANFPAPAGGLQNGQRPPGALQPGGLSPSQANAEAPTLSATEADALEQAIMISRLEAQQAQEALRVARAAEAQERRSLIESQEAEYNESLIIDAQREAEKKRQQQEEEDARRKEEEDLAQAKQAEEDRQKAVLALIDDARARLPAEPAADAAGRMRISVSIPDGRRLTRSFLAADTVAQIHDYAIVEGGETLASQQFRLFSRPPRVVYDDMTVTLEAAKLQGMSIFVEIIEDE